MREFVLICAVVIHGPDFLVAAALADERDLRAGDSRQAAGKLADDFIGELMRELARIAPRWLAPRYTLPTTGGADGFCTSLNQA